MIVVVGSPAWRTAEPAAPAGRACGIALAAARAGARVELLGRIGDDAAGDALLIALARAGVGHVSMLRDPARITPVVEPEDEDEAPTGAEAATTAETADAGAGRGPLPAPRLEPEDVALGLRYLPGFEVLVLSDDAPLEVVGACVEAAGFAGARLVLAVPPGRDTPDGLPPEATVLAAPDEEGDAFAALLGRFAAALDQGEAAEAAFHAATGEGWGRAEA